MRAERGDRQGVPPGVFEQAVHGAGAAGLLGFNGVLSSFDHVDGALVDAARLVVCVVVREV